MCDVYAGVRTRRRSGATTSPEPSEPLQKRLQANEAIMTDLPLDPFSYMMRELDRRGIGCLTPLEPDGKDLETASRSSTSPRRFVP